MWALRTRDATPVCFNLLIGCSEISLERSVLVSTSFPAQLYTPREGMGCIRTWLFASKKVFISPDDVDCLVEDDLTPKSFGKSLFHTGMDFIKLCGERYRIPSARSNVNG